MNTLVQKHAVNRLCSGHAAHARVLRPARNIRPLVVKSALSLSGIWRHSAAAGRPANAAAVEAPAAAPSTTIHPRKAVVSVPLADRPTVELVMALTNLAANPAGPLAAQLSEHELRLVTTSATCDDMFASALDSFSEDYGCSGDGMAMPIADIRAAAEQLAAEVKGNSFASDWNPSTTPGSSSFSATSTSHAAQPGYHTLEQLQAQNDYSNLSSPKSAKEASSMMARVQSLHTQIKAAAAKAAAASKPYTGQAKPGQQQAKQGAGASSSSPSSAAASAKKPAPASGATSDDDSYYGDAAAMPVVPRLGSYGLAGFAGSSSSSSASANAAKRSAQPSYPVYTDPASTWVVADSADCRLRHIVIQAPESLAAAVAGTRASSDLTTFENYSMGAKINKRLYQEANALYNRFMPLLLDHLEERGPDARVMLSGSGLGGSLAALLLLMFVARGMRANAFAPVHTLNAPAVLCEVPNAKQWCSKDGCSLEDMDGMLEDLLHRGILSELGLAQDAVRNIYHQQAAAEAAVQAVHTRGRLQAVAASGSKYMAQHLDVAALQQSPLVPDVLKAWLKAEGSGVKAGFQRLHILNPVGKMLLYVGASGN